jgi:hypothetical protein
MFDDLIINPQTDKRVPLNPDDYTYNSTGRLGAALYPDFFGK